MYFNNEDTSKNENPSDARKSLLGTSRSQELCEQLCYFQKESLYCDTDLQSSDGEHFPAHKVVLASAGEYFRVLFERWEATKFHLELTEMSSFAIRGLLEYAYTRTIKLSTYEFAEVVEIVQALRFCSCPELIIAECVCHLGRKLQREDFAKAAQLCDQIDCKVLEKTLASEFWQRMVFEAGTRIEKELPVSIVSSIVSEYVEQSPYVRQGLEAGALIEELEEWAGNTVASVEEEKSVKPPTEWRENETVNREVVKRKQELVESWKNMLVYDYSDRVEDKESSEETASKEESHETPCILLVGQSFFNDLIDGCDLLLLAASVKQPTTLRKVVGCMTCTSRETFPLWAANVLVEGKVFYSFGGGIRIKGQCLLEAARKSRKYEVSHGRWTNLKPMPEERVNATATYLSGKIYVIGGSCLRGRCKTEHSSALIYDIATNSWKEISYNLPLHRCNHAAVADPERNMIYISAGSVQRPWRHQSKENFEINMSTGACRTLPEFRSTRTKHGVHLVVFGRHRWLVQIRGIGGAYDDGKVAGDLETLCLTAKGEMGQKWVDVELERLKSDPSRGLHTLGVSSTNDGKNLILLRCEKKHLMKVHDTETMILVLDQTTGSKTQKQNGATKVKWSIKRLSRFKTSTRFFMHTKPNLFPLVEKPKQRITSNMLKYETLNEHRVAANRAEGKRQRDENSEDEFSEDKEGEWYWRIGGSTSFLTESRALQ